MRTTFTTINTWLTALLETATGFDAKNDHKSSAYSYTYEYEYKSKSNNKSDK